MIKFDERDPYPLLEPGTHTYPEAQEHSKKVDKWLGLQTEQVEAVLLENAPPARIAGKRQELWIGLPTQALLTPYTEIRRVLEQIQLRAEQTVVDLGAGYARIGFVIGAHYPKTHFIGYEYVKERVVEAKRCLQKWPYPLIEVYEADLSSEDFQPLPADVYFLYDYGTREAIAKTLEDLRIIAQNRAITVIGRGRASRDAIERLCPWLSQVIPPHHYEHYSIYRTAAEA